MFRVRFYPDVIEQRHEKCCGYQSITMSADLPDMVDFKKIIEPLRDLFKDECEM